MALTLAKRALCNLQTLQNNFFRLSLADPITIPIRGKKQLNRPRLRNPTWFLRKERVLHNDYITPENQNFIKEVVHDKYGVPAVIGGVPTYQNAGGLLRNEPVASGEWNNKIRRSGVIARKIGNCPMWLKDGSKIHATLLQVVDNHVVKYIPPQEYNPPRKFVRHLRNPSKYGALVVGGESTDPSLLTKEYCGLFKNSGVMPKKILTRFLISPEAAMSPGTPLLATHFRVGDFVDVRGKTIDRGFQGVMKRWGFKGMPASHGVTKTHRRGGNIGAGGQKARVWPGTKMPGHMGNRHRVLRGLRIWRINTKYNVLWVQGLAIPGETNSVVYIHDTLLPLRKLKDAPPFPTYYPTEPLPEDIYYETVHGFDEPTIMYTPE